MVLGDDDEISVVRFTAFGCDALSHEQHQTGECVAECDGGRPSHRRHREKYEFNPSPIRVKQGTRVQLKITATDHAHGFRIKLFPDGTDTKGNAGLVFSSLQDCQKIEKGQTEIVEFVAQTPGTYPFKCCTRCGWHHRA